MARDRGAITRLKQRMQEASRAAVTEFGRESAGQLATLIGVQGPPRSKPGEPPHRETGRLQGSVDHQEFTTGTGALTVIYEDTPYALALEFGYAPNNLAPRPHVRTQKARGESRLRDIAAKHLGAI